MKKQLKWIIPVVVLAALISISVKIWYNPDDTLKEEALKKKCIFLAENMPLLSTAGKNQEKAIRSLLRTAQSKDSFIELKIDYPLDESLFPPEIVPPMFLWSDESEKADTWLIDIAFENDSKHLYILAPDNPLPDPELDIECFNAADASNPPCPVYKPPSTNWTPESSLWETVKANSVEKYADISMYGFSKTNPEKILSHGKVRIMTSKDPVGAPIFYRDVPMVSVARKLEDELKGIIAPIPKFIIDMIVWRLRDISKPESRVVLKDIPTCANCHSFSADGSTLGMDIDGPAGDKGGYAIAKVSSDMKITHENIISWNYSYKKKYKSLKKTIGFLSQISPSGKYAVTTLNESVFLSNFSDHKFIQVFYPTRGILGVYSSELDDIMMLPGADSPDYVHCDPTWTPDSKHIVFARSGAMDPNIEGRPRPEYANDPNETPIQYDLYSIPFNSGSGGKAVPIEGASHNGMSNTFPKVSPDGKWLVYVKCKNGQLMRPDSRLWIVPADGGEAREMKCNTPLMNSWHSFSPNSRWLAFASKGRTHYTRLYLTHIDEDGNDSPAIIVDNCTASNRAVNIPEFVNIAYDDLVSIEVPAVEYRRHYKKAVILGNQEKYKEAYEEIKKAFELNPDDLHIKFDLYLRAGIALHEFGDTDGAIENWKKSIEVDPLLSTDPYYLIGIGYATQKKYKDAYGYFEKTIEVAPKHTRAYYYLTLLNLEQEAPDLYNPQKALKIAQKNCELTFNKEPLMLEILAWAYAADGQFDEAIKTAEIALEFAKPRKIAGHVKRIQDKIELYKQGKAK
ncbi:hypothetical protein ACFL30_01890 [Candidatus Latescibacterota bacterium]